MDDTQISLPEISRLDARALAQAYDLFASDIYRYAYRHTRNARLADRTVGEVFNRLLEQLSLGSGPRSDLRAYLFGIAYRALVAEARRVQPLPPQATPAADGNVDGALLDAIWGAIREELTDEQRHVIVLRFWEDFSLEQTARIMGETVAHIQALQRHAVAVLRKVLDRGELQTSHVESASASRKVL